MRSNLDPKTILRELHQDYDLLDSERVGKQILAVEQYLDRWTEKTTEINRKMLIAYLKGGMESSCINSVDDRAILYTLLKHGYKIRKAYGDYCANLKFSAEAIKDAQGMKLSGTFNIFPQKYEKLCQEERWRALLDPNLEMVKKPKI